MAIVPTWYTNKATPVDNDSLWGYDSEAVENKNFLFSAIQTYVLNWLTTTDVSEWTNLYYTDARVDANSTVTWKADKTNVLELDNTTVYTPTLDYHPVTKKYVDEQPSPDASETVKGIAEIANATEASAWLDDTRIMTSKKVYDNYGIYTSTIWNNIVIWDSNTPNTWLSNTAYEKKKEIEIGVQWDVSYEIKIENETVFSVNLYARIYINGVATWVEHVAISVDSWDWEQVFTWNITWLIIWDLVQVYTYESDDNARTYSVNGLKIEAWTINRDFTYSTINL